MAADTRELAERFHKLFTGLHRAHGHYTPKGARPGQKTEGSATTVRTPATVELWERHIEGDYGLGVVPILSDSTCCWAAIDVDEYNLDHQKVVKDVERLGLPLLVARTKSGGAHLYLFLSEPVLAEIVRNKLMEWSVLLGYAGVEVFPKQVKLADSEHDLGNWLNMPYFAGSRTSRYGFKEDGSSLTMVQFLKYAEKISLDKEGLQKVKPLTDERVEVLLAEGPPCLQSLAIHGFPAGTRNNALFAIAVYLRKRYGDDWQTQLDEYNQKFMIPPLGHKEVVLIKKSVSNKDYNYKCSDQPICQACSRQICLTRKYGVGGNSNDPGVMFGDLVRVMTEPEVSYIWDVDGIRVYFENSWLILDQRKFRKQVMDTLGKLTNFVDEKTWLAILREKLANAQVQVPPADVTPAGQLWANLESFLSKGARAQELDEILLGRPYMNGTRSYFRAQDFLEYLQRHRAANGLTTKSLFVWLRDNGAEHHHQRLKGKMQNYWSIPTPEMQTEDFAVPVLETEIDDN